MVDKDYIFNIPRTHIEALLMDIYVNSRDVWNITVQEIGEFLQAYSKHFEHKGNLEERHAQRGHLIEEMVHVLICLGMIADQEGLTQTEIEDQIRKKAINGVKYPFDIAKHAPLDLVIKDLLNCAAERTPGRINPDHSCRQCKTGEFGKPTVTCRPLLEDALYYLQQAYGKTEGPDQK